MKKYMYCFKDKELNCFGNPRFEEIPPETYAIGMKRGLVKAFKPEQLSVFAGQELHLLGVYNDETGEVTDLQDKLLLDCDAAIAERKDVQVKEGVHDVSIS